jgi:hypothetical protein
VGPKAGLDDVEKRKFLTLPGLPIPRSFSPTALPRLPIFFGSIIFLRVGKILQRIGGGETLVYWALMLILAVLSFQLVTKQINLVQYDEWNDNVLRL